MKILSDHALHVPVRHGVPDTGMPAKPRQDTGRQSNVQNAVNAPRPAGLDALRDVEARLTEALSISQMAQSIINRAMAVSNRLKNLAMEAMVSGGVRYEDIAEAGAQLKSSLREYSERFTLSEPSLTPPAPLTNLNDAGRSVRNTTAGELEVLERIEGAFRSDRLPKPEDMDILGKNLELERDRLVGEVDMLTGEGKSLLEGYRTTIAEGNAFRTTSDTGTMIITNMDTALIAQGNINRENLLSML